MAEKILDIRIDDTYGESAKITNVAQNISNL